MYVFSFFLNKNSGFLYIFLPWIAILIGWYLCDSSCISTLPFSSKVSHPQRSLISQDHICPPRQVGEWRDSRSAAVDACKAGSNHINELRAWMSQTRLRLWRTSALPHLETAEMLQDHGSWCIKMDEIKNKAFGDWRELPDLWNMGSEDEQLEDRGCPSAGAVMAAVSCINVQIAALIQMLLIVWKCTQGQFKWSLRLKQ